ncbi:MAG: group III truncated hemoglobin [Aridibacter sp.]
MKDIETREDIDALMQKFYKRAFADDEIGFIFTDVVKLDLEKHLPIIGDFWDSLLLGAKNYQKHGRNPLQIHGEIDQKTPLTAEHFRRWLEIFRTTVDEMFAGTRAEFAKSRAEAIANRMLNFVNNVPGIESMKRENDAEVRDFQA